MSTKPFAAFACAIALALLSSCVAGPRRLSNYWGDWTNRKYADNAWLTSALSSVLPVYPLVASVMWVGDFLVVNPYYFWGKDAWDNKGTAYVHENPSGASKTVSGIGM